MNFGKHRRSKAADQQGVARQKEYERLALDWVLRNPRATKEERMRALDEIARRLTTG